LWSRLDFSLTTTELKKLVDECNLAWEARGKQGLNRAEAEKQNMVFRRSLYFVNDLTAGDKITQNDIKRIRPGYGIEPKYYDEIIGKVLKKDAARGEPVSFEHFQIKK